MASLVCPDCGAKAPEPGARFCGGCGAAFGLAQPGPQSAAGPDVALSGPEVALCGGCGAIAHPRGAPCGLCGAPRNGTSPRATRPQSTPYWVALHCRFGCRVCGHESPLNHFDADGSVQCLRCGTEQKFDPNQWRALIDHAFAVGDLSGPDPEGRYPSAASIAALNPFAEVGVSSQYAELEVGETTNKKHALTLRAAPGHPVSTPHGAPLELVSQNAFEATLRCPASGSATTYALPQAAREAGVKAIVADEHVKGRAHARVSSGASAITISCPNCSAPLAVAGVGTVATCSFCSTTCIVPAGALRGLGRTDIAPSVWWMLFEGPSRERKRLERKLESNARKEEAARQAAEKKARREADRARSVRESARRSPPPRKPTSASTGRVSLYMIAGLIALGAITWGAFKQPLAPDKQVPHAAAALPAPVPAPTPLPAARPKPRAHFDVLWTAKLTKAEGKKLKKGTSCDVTARTDGEKVEDLTVQCADERVYALSESPGMGFTSRSFEVFPVEAEGGAVRYRLVYQDIGQRTGRAQVRMDSKAGQAVIEQPNLPSFKLELTVDELSHPVVKPE